MGKGDNQKGAKHLTELTLGIDGIKKALEEAKAEIESASVEAKNIWDKNVQSSLNNVPKSQTINIDVDTSNTDKAMKNLNNSVTEVKSNFAGLSKITEKTFDEQDYVAEKVKNTYLGLGKSIIRTEKAVLDEKGRFLNDYKTAKLEVVNDEIKAQQEINKAVKEQEKLEEKRQKEERKRAEQRQKTIDEYNKAQAKQQEEYKKTSLQLEELTKKQLRFNEALMQKGDAGVSEDFLNKNKKYSQLLDHLNKQLEANGKLTERQKMALSSLSKGISSLNVNKLNDDYSKLTKSITDLMTKQKAYTALASQKTGKLFNASDVQTSKELEKELEKLALELKAVGRYTPETAAKFEELKVRSAQLGNEIKKTAVAHESWLQRLRDKASWLSAFWAIEAFKRGFVESIKVIKETEDAVVELQRVLSEDISQNTISDELYGISYKYGRAFKDVQEVAVKFAQTGAEWNDVLKLTESTMLALNTAELNVKESTEGLIAIMSQWNIEATDMEKVIDKINITADSFPVTSEKIVAALQRASSSAKNANLSLEETIGVVTALSKATGRSGANLGTAINSLLIYTTKTKALETFFEVGNQAVKDTVTAYKNGAASILDVWKALSKNLEQMSESQKNKVYQGIGGDKFAQDLEQNAGDIIDNMKKIYGSAGTFRQNYLTALLKDIDKVDEVTDNMTNAIGYSAKENEKYMKTLSAYYEQLVATWREVAVQTTQGRVNMLNLGKLILQVGIGVGKLSKAVGGIVPILTAVTSALFIIKRQKLQEKLDNVKDKVKKLGEAMNRGVIQTKSYDNSLKGLSDRAKNLTIRFKNLREEFSKMNGVGKFGVITTALSGVVMAYNAVANAIEKYREKQREERQDRIEAYETQLNSVEANKQLYEEMTKLESVSNKTSEEQSRLRDITLEMANSLRIATTNADGTGKSLEQLREEIKKAKAEMFSLNELDAEAYIEDLDKELQEAAIKKSFLVFKVSKLSIDKGAVDGLGEDIRQELLKQFKDFKIVGDGRDFGFKADKEEAKSWYERTYAITQYIQERSKIATLNKVETDFYQARKRQLNDLAPAYERERKFQIQNQIYQDTLNDTLPRTKEELTKYADGMYDVIGASEVMKDVIAGFVYELLPDEQKALLETTETLTKSSEQLGNEIDEVQSKFSSVYEVVTQYNEQGNLTIDMVQKLISTGWDYIDLLDITENGIKLNEEKTNALIEAQKQNAVEMIKQSFAAEAYATVCKYVSKAQEKQSETTEEATEKSQTFEGSVKNVALSMLGLAITTAEANKELSDLIGKEYDGLGIDEKALNAELGERFEEAKGLINWITNSDNDVAMLSSKAIKSSTNATKKAMNEQKKAIEERYKTEKKEITETKKAIKERFDEEKKTLNEQKEAVKEKYKTQIDALKEIQKENSRLDKQEDYLKNKQKAEKDLARAEVRSGVEYQEKKQEALENLEDIEKDWRKQQRDWETEDKIKAIEKQRDAEVKIIEDKIKALEKQKDLEIKLLDEKLKRLEENKDKELKGIEDVESVQKQSIRNVGEYSVRMTEETAKKKLEIEKENAEKIKKVNTGVIDEINSYAKKKNKEMQKFVGTNGLRGMSFDFLNAGLPMNPLYFPQNTDNSSTQYYDSHNSTRTNIVSANVYNSTSRDNAKSIFFEP